MVDWVGTISPTLILNARASYNRFIEKGYGAANEGFDLTSLGISPSLLAQLPSPIYFGRWNFNNGYNSLGRSQSNNFTNTYQLQFSATKVTGSHTIKAGFDIRQINYEQQNTGNILQLQLGNTNVDAENLQRGRIHQRRRICVVPVGHRQRIFQLPAVPVVEAVLLFALRAGRLEGQPPPDFESRAALGLQRSDVREVEPPERTVRPERWPARSPRRLPPTWPPEGRGLHSGGSRRRSTTTWPTSRAD